MRAVRVLSALSVSVQPLNAAVSAGESPVTETLTRSPDSWRQRGLAFGERHGAGDAIHQQPLRAALQPRCRAGERSTADDDGRARVLRHGREFGEDRVVPARSGEIGLGRQVDAADLAHPVRQVVVPDQRLVERHGARAEHDDGEVPRPAAGRQQRGLGHADDRHGEELARGGEAAVERDREDGGVVSTRMVREDVEHGMRRHGIARMGRDDVRAEARSRAFDLRSRRADAACFRADRIRHRLRRIAVDEQQPHRLSP